MISFSEAQIAAWLSPLIWPFVRVLALFTAGAAMHALCTRLGFEWRTSLITALGYLGCGYFIGDLQHLNWVWGAALLPWCAAGFLRFTSSGQWRELPASLLPFFLFMVSAHPGLMIGAMYFFLFWTIARCVGIDAIDRGDHSWLPMTRALALAGSLFLICLGLAYGYGYNLLLTTRAPGGIFSGTSPGAFTITSWISGFLPLATVDGDKFFNTDIALRNGYFGILPIGLIIYAWAFQRNRWTIFWTIVMVFFLFISSDISIKWLPLVSQVRLSGEFRIFAILAALMVSAPMLHQLFRSPGEKGNRFAAQFSVMTVFFALLALAALVMVLSNQESVIRGRHFGSIKSFLQHLNVFDAIALQSGLQALICFGLWRSFRQASFRLRRIVLLVVVDMTLSAWMNLPYTGVGSRSVADMQALIDGSPKGIPEPVTATTISITSAYPSTDSIIGNWGLYSKQIAWSRKAAYPMSLKESADFFPTMSDSLMGSSTIFSAGQEKACDAVLNWEPDHLAFRTNLDAPITVGIKQTHHPGWQGDIDGQRVIVKSGWSGLNTIDVPAGPHRVDLYFRDPLARWAQAFHFTIFLLLIILAYRLRRKEALPA